MKKKIILFLVLALILNLIWEFAHAPLYISQMLETSYNLTLIKASFGDLILISIIFALISLKNKKIKWINKPSKIDYGLIILLGIITAIFIELRAFSLDKWSYTELMPTIFGIGITPLVQLAVTSLIALWLARKI